MKIFNIDLDIANTDLENQLIIEAKAKYALIEGYDYIEDSEGRLFELTEEDDTITLTEVSTDYDSDYDEEEYEDVEEDLERLTNSELIETIIRNSLLSVDPITLEQAQTMLVLANLKALLEAE